jgi:hypothetical protein
MRRRKPGSIGIAMGGDQLRAAQLVDGQMVCASVPVGPNPARALRQLLSSAPFVGRDVVIGIEGEGVLIESFVLPPGASKDVRKACSERLKGDPLFDAERALLGATVPGASTGETAGAGLVIMAALDHERLGRFVKAWRELGLNVMAVEPAALAAWRAWRGDELQARLVVSGRQAMLLLGRDERLLFCRILERPVVADEVRQTLTRAASLLGLESIGRLATAGLDEDERAGLDELAIDRPEWDGDDVVTSGLATEGPRAIDFTPPEERVLREKRRVRKAGLSLAACCGAILLSAGLIGTHNAGQLDEQLETLISRRDGLERQRAELAELQARLDQTVANESVLIKARPGHRLSRLVELIASQAGSDISLETVRIDDLPDPARAARVAESGPDPRRLEIQLHGLSRRGVAVRDYADALLSTGAFSDVRVEASERVLLGIGVEGERFRIFATAETH